MVCVSDYGLCIRLWSVLTFMVCVYRHLRSVSPSMACVSVFGLCLRLRSVLTLFYNLCLDIYGLCLSLWSLSLPLVCVSDYGLC